VEAVVKIEDEPATPHHARIISAGQLEKLRHVNLAKFLTYPAGREAFRAFTVKEFSVENLLFVEAVKAIKDKPTLPTKEDGQAVWDQYIAEAAPSQVNLPSVTCQRLKARMEESEGLEIVAMFDDSVDHVMKLMQRDAFKRFQRTPDWVLHVVVFVEKPKEGATTTPATAETTNPATTLTAPAATTASESPSNSLAPLVNSAGSSSLAPQSEASASPATTPCAPSLVTPSSPDQPSPSSSPVPQAPVPTDVQGAAAVESIQ
jgi:hypothetical protein